METMSCTSSSCGDNSSLFTTTIRCIEFHTEFFKPIITESDKSVFVGYDDRFYFLFHYFI